MEPSCTCNMYDRRSLSLLGGPIWSAVTREQSRDVSPGNASWEVNHGINLVGNPTDSTKSHRVMLSPAHSQDDHISKTDTRPEVH